MFNISNNQHITITRGDSAVLVVYINVGTELDPCYRDLGPYDKVYFGVMEPNCPFEHAIMRKVFTADDVYDNRTPGEAVTNPPYIRVVFKPEDTEKLLPGLYYYEVKLLTQTDTRGSNATVDTIIAKHKFVIID